MKLAVAVLSSILLACSVTTANPVNPSATTDVETSTSTVIPSATTDVEAITSPTPNPNGIGLGGLDQLPSSIKELLDKHLKLSHARDEQKKVCDPLKPESGGSPKYDGEIQKTKADLEAQKVKLKDIRSRYYECQLKTCYIELDLSLIKIELVECVFGETWDPESTERKLLLIGQHPSVMRYFGELGNKGQSSECNECLGQNPSDQQQHQEPQPSPNTSSGSGSPGQKAPSNRQKGSSKFMGKLKSFFGRPK
ncbi:hypothetical protein QVD99_001410 [Batrachochytrium dendrobatidis]|nr:hypothetical protein QVD99_001410 [Batrachochytrium dendrobatidis]